MMPNVRIRLGAVLLLLVAGAPGCESSSAKYRDASGDIADRLADQVQKRTDPRLLRVMIYEFEPCFTPSRSAGAPRAGAHQQREIARQIKHQLITALARRMVVIEGDALEYSDRRGSGRRPPIGDGPEESIEPYPEARILGANAVLVGNYAVQGDDGILVLARLVDAGTNEILATAEETIDDVELP